MGVLVIEAAQKSGTGITVNYARRQGKAIFCIPNSLENKKGEGTNRLLKRDGKLVTNANDILEYFNIKQIKQISIDEIEKQVDVKPEYKKIYKVIQKGEIHINQISKETKINEEVALKWLNQGAIPTDTVRNLLSKAGIMKKFADSKKKDNK